MGYSAAASIVEDNRYEAKRGPICEAFKKLASGAYRLAAKGVRVAAGAVRRTVSRAYRSVKRGAAKLMGGARRLTGKMAQGARRLASKVASKVKAATVAALAVGAAIARKAAAKAGEIARRVASGAARLGRKVVAKAGQLATAVGRKASQLARRVGQTAERLATAVGRTIGRVAERVGRVAAQVGRKVLSVADRLTGGLASKAIAFGGRIMGGIGKVLSWVVGKAKAAASAIKHKASQLKEKTLDLARSAKERVVQTARRVSAAVKAKAKEVAKAVKQTATRAAKAVARTAKGAATAVKNGAKKAAQVAAATARSAAGAVKAGLKRAGAATVGAVRSGASWARGKAVDAGRWVKREAKAAGRWVADKAKKAGRTALQHITGSRAYKLAKRGVGAVAPYVKKAGQAVSHVAKRVWSVAEGPINTALDVTATCAMSPLLPAACAAVYAVSPEAAQRLSPLHQACGTISCIASAAMGADPRDLAVEGVDTATEVIPYVSTAKSACACATDRNVVTGEDTSTGSRLLGCASTVADILSDGIGGAAMKGALNAGDGAKLADKAADAKRLAGAANALKTGEKVVDGATDAAKAGAGVLPKLADGYHWVRPKKGKPYIRRNPGRADDLPQLHYDGKHVRPRIPSTQFPKRAPSAGSSLETSSFEYATEANKQDHIFASKHKLGHLVEKFGSREAVIREMLGALDGQTPSRGTFETSITLAGQALTVRGAVVDGVVKIGTAFKP